MSAVRVALRALRGLGPREKVYAEFLGSADSLNKTAGSHDYVNIDLLPGSTAGSRGFVAANEVSESFPTVEARGARGYGLVCGERPARPGDVVLRVPPAVWLPYCAESAVVKAEAAAPDFVARLSKTCNAIGGGTWVAPFSCLALEMLFALERDKNEPYLSRLWEASRSETCLPHPLLMGPAHLELLQASPLRDDISTAAKVYSSLHRSLFNLHSDDGIDGMNREALAATPSATSTRDFLWALGVILSRAVQEEGAGGAGLVPYLDFANHGDREKSRVRTVQGEEGVASCERGFDPATGCHFLRVLRDVQPGKELSIDYRSTEKGMYRFARTYGFVTRAHNPSGRPESESPPNDTVRVLVRLPAPHRPRTPAAHSPKLVGVSRDAAALPLGAEQQPKGEDAGHILRTAAGAGQNRPGGDESDSGKADGEIPSWEHEETKDVEVGVRLGDVSNALLGLEAPPIGRNRSPSFPGATAAAPGQSNTRGNGKADAEWKLAVSRALEDRLRRYPTSLEDDLQVLRRAAGGRNNGLGISEDGEVFTSSDRNRRKRSVTPEWVDMCVNVRAAEKIALRRALAEVHELSSG